MAAALLPWPGLQSHRREVAEVLVGTVTYVVCARVGLDVGGEAIPYLAGWGEHDATSAVSRLAKTIDRISETRGLRPRPREASRRSPAAA